MVYVKPTVKIYGGPLLQLTRRLSCHYRFAFAIREKVLWLCHIQFEEKPSFI